MQGAFPPRREPRPPTSNLAAFDPEAWCTKLVGIRMPSLPSSPCHSFAQLSMLFARLSLRPRLRTEYRRNGPRPMLRNPRPPVDVISCNQPPGSRPISVPEAKRGDFTSEAARDKASTPNPSTISSSSRHTEYWDKWDSTIHH
ncbi:hypothetical protein CSAL01_00639 [Colletotrichum salicis]|uniref:Uncharacterized protein n=1 Tax=Colletotrichum salicis TaxID=1209931 RepID=A0A135V5J9_9PEZI|nr:hypothetical protein CSAL01_00639 [Colletotrichum salicis]